MGQTAPRKFLFPQLGAFEDSTNRVERLDRLARLFVQPKNGRLTRTIVNRLWARLLGRGLIEPVDEMDGRPWDTDLLDWLAGDLAANGYDLKHTLALIATARAYRLPSVGGQEQPSDAFVFQGPVVKRLTAEQYADAVSTLTGVWHRWPANPEIDFGLPDRSAIPPFPAASWIWNMENAGAGAPPGTIYFRKTLNIVKVPATALAVAAADNRFTLFVNGHEAGSGDDWNRPRLIDLQPHLRPGHNVLAVAATNGEVKEGDPTPNPAGLLLAVWLGPPQPDRNRKVTPQSHRRSDRGDVVTALGTGSDWCCSTQKLENWHQPEFNDASWHKAAVVGGPATAPWNAEARMLVAWSQGSQVDRVRASLVASDPLLSALGRPGREQVVTSRPTVATTLQGLELANGATLAAQLDRGARRLVEGSTPSAQALADQLYRQALGRAPTRSERQLACAAIGSPPRHEGIADLLWALSLLPEFQLVE
jgi:hypothetical protein